MSRKGRTLINNKTANKICSVYDCHSKISREISLHKLPNDERRSTWIQVLRLGKVPRNTFICSQHFKKEDYILPGKKNYNFYYVFLVLCRFL